MTLFFTLSRAAILSIITIANSTSLVLSAIAVHEKTGGVLQISGIGSSAITLLTIIGCLSHQFTHRGEEASNVRNLGLLGSCVLSGFVQAVTLSVHARQQDGAGLCNDFAHTASPCVLADVELSMAYVSTFFAVVGFIISWIDKFPGAVKVTARYPVTKAPSSLFAAHTQDLDESYTHPPAKASRSRNNSEWCDVPLPC